MINVKFIEKYAEPLRVKRNAIITNFGYKEHFLYYIQEGLIRKHSYDEEGNEFTFDFISEGNFVSSYESYILETPSKFIVEAATDCVLLRLSKDMRDDIIMSAPEEIDSFIRMIELIFLNNLKRKELFLKSSKFIQFKMLLEDKPYLFENVQKQHIASYLGVAPQTISKWFRTYYEEA